MYVGAFKYRWIFVVSIYRIRPRVIQLASFQERNHGMWERILLQKLISQMYRSHSVQVLP